MSRRLAIAIIGVLAFALHAFAGQPLTSVSTSSGDRYFVSKLVDAQHVVLQRGAEATTFVFLMQPGDSIKVDLGGAPKFRVGSENGDAITMRLMSAESDVHITTPQLGQWIAAPANGGKTALLIGRGAYGDRMIDLAELTVFRKSNVSTNPVSNGTANLLQINHLTLEKASGGKAASPTVFCLNLKEDDSYRVRVAGSQGQASGTVVGNVFKTGEAFAKQPITIDGIAELPASGEGNAQFCFEFWESSTSKGSNLYHIDIDRFPSGKGGDPSKHDR